MRSTTVERLLTQQEVVDLTGLHVCTLIRARRAGELRAVKIGRRVKYREPDVARWIEANVEAGA